VPNPNPYDQTAYDRAVKRLQTAIAALWKAGATPQQIEDEVEDAMLQAGVEE
jgi:hypothetical protein